MHLEGGYRGWKYSTARTIRGSLLLGLGTEWRPGFPTGRSGEPHSAGVGGEVLLGVVAFGGASGVTALASDAVLMWTSWGT